MHVKGGTRKLVRRGITMLSTMTLGLIGLIVGGGPALASYAPDGSNGGGSLPIPSGSVTGSSSTGSSVLTVVLIAIAAAAFAALLTLAASTYQHHHHAPTPA
jgi:hypothetical protein